MSGEIDNLEIKISADSSSAAANVDALADALDKLATASSNVSRDNLNQVADGVASIKDAFKNMASSLDGLGQLNEALKSLSEIKPPSGLEAVAKALKPIKEITGFAHMISSGKTLEKAAVNFGGFITAMQMASESDINTENLQRIGSALSSLYVNADAAKSFNALSRAIKSLSGVTVDNTLTQSLREFIDTIHGISDEDSERLKAVAAAASALKGKKIDEIVGESAIKDASLFKTILKGLIETLSAFNEKLGSLAGAIGKGVFTVAKAEFKALAESARASFSIIKASMTGMSAIVKGVFSPLTMVGRKMKESAEKVGGFLASIKRVALYRAIRTALKAISQGIQEGRENLYQYSLIAGTQFAKSMDMAATAALYLKNSIGAATAPLTNYFVPIIDKVVDSIVELINKFNELTAVMTGADTWTKALKYPIQWEDAAEDANSAAKKLKSTMLGFDELNVIEPPTSGSKSKLEDSLDYSRMFEEVRTDMQDAFGISDIIIPIKMAWDEQGEKTLKHIKGTFESILGLVNSIKRDFKTIWMSGAGTTTIETILQIFQNILGTVGAIASGMALAWDSGETGLNIIGNIWGAANNVLTVFNNIWASIRKMAEQVDWSPLYNSFEKLAESIDKITNPSGGAAQLLQRVFDNIILPIGEWIIESGLPTAIDAVSAAFDTLRTVFDNLNSNEAFKNAIETFEVVSALSFNNILELAKSLGTTISELFKDEKFAESLTHVVSIISHIIGSIGNLAGGFKDAWDEGNHGETIFNKIASAANNILTILDNIWADIEQWASGVNWTPLLNALDSLFDAIDQITNPDSGVAILLKGVFNDIIKPLATWVVESGLPSALDLVSTALTGINNVLIAIDGSETAQNVLEFFKMLSGLTFEGITGLTDVLSSIIAVLTGQDIPDSVAERLENNFFSSKGNKISGIMDDLGQSVYDWLYSDQLDEEGLLKEGASAPLAKRLAALSPVGMLIYSVKESIVDLVETIKNTPTDEVMQTISDIVEWITNPGGKIGEKLGENSGISIAELWKIGMNEFKANIEEDIQFVKDLWEKIKKKFNEVFGIKNNQSSESKKIGDSVANGIKAGIAEPFNKIKTWLQEKVFDPFVNGFKDLFKINSPSKVMEEQGNFVTDGLLNGIKEQFSISKISEWIRSNLFTPFTNAVKSVFGVNKNGESESGKSLGQSIVSGIKTAFSAADFSDTGAEVTSGIGSGVSSSFSDNILGKITEKVDFIKKLFSKEEFTESGENIVAGIGSGFNDQGNYDRNLGQWVLEKVSWIKNAFSSNEFVGVGEGIAAGIGDGIRNSQSVLEEALQYAIAGFNELAQQKLVEATELLVAEPVNASRIPNNNRFLTRGAGYAANRSEGMMSNVSLASGVADAVYNAMIQAAQMTSNDGGTQIPNINLYIDRKELTTQIEEQQKSNGVRILGAVAYQ